MRSFWLIADDFAQSAAIDRGILELGQRGRLSGTSVMTTSPALKEAAHSLSQLPAMARGLHFNLTHTFSSNDRRFSLPQVWWLSLSRQWDAGFLRSQWLQQLQDFEQAFGHCPDFIDGHQHVHQLPVIRQVMLEVVQQRYGRLLPLRQTHPAIFRGGKAWIIDQLGGRCLPAAAAMNSDLAGVYDFVPEHFPSAMNNWLSTLRTGGLIMCHPGYYDSTDVLSHSRPNEREWLASAWFSERCQALDVVLLQRCDLVGQVDSRVSSAVGGTEV